MTCFNHVRRNIKDKLHDLGIDKAIQAEVLDDIFSRRVGSTLLTGLVDSNSLDMYEEKLGCLLTKWRKHDPADSSDKLVNQFCSWLIVNKDDVIRDSMLLPVRGLGSPPDHFYTNSSECVNNVLKVNVNYKKTELTLFIDKICQLIEEQATRM